MAALVILAAACALATIATATVLAICALSGRLSRAEEDQALAFSARTPPAAGSTAAPAPQASPRLAAPPPGQPSPVKYVTTTYRCGCRRVTAADTRLLEERPCRAHYHFHRWESEMAP